MLDCLTYLAHMDADSGCYTTILLLPGGSAIAPSCTISLISVPNDGTLEGGWGVGTSYDAYPSREHATFMGALYRAIIEQDKAISAREFQQLLVAEG